jgi:hypothetical protein
MSNFSFLEYSFDPHIIDPETIYSSFNKLGFVQRNVHASGNASMWTQNRCIVMLRETPLASIPQITGLGLITENTAANSDYHFDEECGMLVAHDPNGFRILAMPEKSLLNMTTYGYQVVDTKQYDTPGLEFFSGFVYNGHNDAILNFYQNMGFTFTKSSNKYDTLMSKNNRFTLMFNKSYAPSSINMVYSDTDDVFKTTCHYAASGLNLAEYNIEKPMLNFGSSLNYKIAGYNCVAFGNENSYSIENSVCQPIPNIDLIFRTRKQHLHINEDTVEFHYAAT